ncbi:MAG: tryptophan--tRNA ligase [Candidatus Shikimatogenerans sp. JK-2022]|nr:tryptophan--tRNA ligase [Candidatus Shikimatogenerans bostrichidophilus]
MEKYITGIQSNGIPHLGNFLSIILPTISLIKNNNKKKIFIMIADLHSLTNFKNNILNKEYIYINAAIWLSFNINLLQKNIYFYRQSDIKEINELFWYLNCFFPFNRLKLSHKYKNNINNNYNVGIINYPILMASDILLLNINKVIIGRDQLQHIEYTRKIAKIFNYKFKKKIFILPKQKIFNNKIIPGIDGKKMSKSLNNTINIFNNKEKLKKQIFKIKTSNRSINKISYYKIKNTILLKIYKLLVNKDEYIYIKEKIKSLKIGFYNIKKRLFNYIIYKFKKERKKFLFYLNNKHLIKKILYKGYKKIKQKSIKKINFIKKYLGLKI